MKAIFFLLISIATTSVNAQSAPVAYEIYNKFSNLPLGNVGYSLSNGFSVEQVVDDHGADTRWMLVQVGAKFRITNQASGLALVDAGYAQGNGFNIGQWTYDGGNDALWGLQDVGSGYYRIINQASGLSLVDAGYAQGPGHSIAQWAYDGGDDAKWSLMPVSGGSNYAWYQVSGCSRESYGVIYNYDTESAIIDQQLAQMYASGQRRIKLPLFFGHGLNTGTVMDSTGGNLSPRFRSNLQGLLAKIKQIGFKQVEIGMYGIGHNAVLNNVSDWSTWNEALFQETWNLIYNLHPILATSGVPYRVDLLNEAIPSRYLNNYNVALEFDQKLWNYYVQTFGKNDTVGFSIIADADRYKEVPAVYGPSPFGNHGFPDVFDIHFYANANSEFRSANDIFNAQGYNPPWMVGEAFYNDSQEAMEISQAIQSTRHAVIGLYQWPLTRSAQCSDVDVNSPEQFSNYATRGF